MSLAERLAYAFRDDDVAKGRRLHARRAVIFADHADGAASGVTRSDGGLHDFALSWKDASGAVEARCGCFRFRQVHGCAHLWAVILALDAACVDVPGDRVLDFTPADIPADEELELDLEPWAKRLKAIAAAVPERHRAGGLYSVAEQEIWYVLDVEGSSEYGVPLIYPEGGRPLAGGGYSLRPLDVSRESVLFLDDAEDRHVLMRMLDLSMGQGRHARAFYIPRCGWEDLLPRMAGRGRLVRRDREHSVHPLSWDATPWQLALHVRHRRGGIRIEGSLRCGSVDRSLKEPILYLRTGLIVFPDSIGQIDDSDPRILPWLTDLRKGGSIRAPGGRMGALLRRLWSTPGLPPIDIPDDVALDAVRVEPARRLLFYGPTGARFFPARVTFDYDGVAVGEDDGRTLLLDEAGRRLLRRDAEAEARALAQIEDLGIVREAMPGARRVEAARFVEIVRELLSSGWAVEAKGQKLRRPGAFTFRLTSGIDWFEVHCDASFDGDSVAFPKLLRAVRRGEDTVALGDGTFGMLPEEWLRRFRMLAGLGVESDGSTIRFSLAQAPLLDALLADESWAETDERFREARAQLREVAVPAPVRAPRGFHGTLRPYQESGLGWLCQLRMRGLHGCLADDMGLGKTVQVLALLLTVARERQDSRLPSLIVVPRSLLYNWIDEAHRFAPGLSIADLAGPDRHVVAEQAAPHAFVTTYGIVRRDIAWLRDRPFRYVILDEAQTIKNPESQTAAACRMLRAEHRLALTGTPLENHVGDLWSILEFLNPGLLGRGATARALATGDAGPEEVQLLARAVRPLMLRRTKREVLAELPDRTEQTLHCELSGSARREYDELKRHYQARLKRLLEEHGLERSQMHVLEALLRLRQAACHPGLTDPARRLEPSAKVDLLALHARELAAEGHKALVFSQFTSFLGIVRQRLEGEGITLGYLDGRTRDRKEVVERFQTDATVSVLLISLKAGGVGLNLTAASYVYILDPWWNPAAEAQAIDRTHRIGQTQPVTAYRLIARDTVEERIAELQVRKKELAEAIVSGGQGGMRGLTEEDLQRLLA